MTQSGGDLSNLNFVGLSGVKKEASMYSSSGMICMTEILIGIRNGEKAFSFVTDMLAPSAEPKKTYKRIILSHGKKTKDCVMN